MYGGRTIIAFISFSTTVILAASYCEWASDQRTRAAYRAVGVTAPHDGKPIYQRSFDSDRASAMEPGEEDTAVRAVAGGPQGARRRAIGTKFGKFKSRLMVPLRREVQRGVDVALVGGNHMPPTKILRIQPFTGG